MKLLAILTYYHPHWTGLTAYAKRLAEGLARRGHTVTVLTSRHSRELAGEETLAGVRIVRVPVLGRLSRGTVSPRFPAVAARLIREHDVVQIHAPLLESLLVALLCRRIGRPLVLTNHGDLVMPAGVFNQAVERVVVGMMTAAARLASAVTTHSRDYAEHSDFLWPFAPKLRCIYPPVEMPVPVAEEAAAWRRELGLEGKRLIGFAGRFVEEKGFDHLLQAVPAILAAEPDAHLVYAGEVDIVYERFFQRWRPLVDHHRAHLTLLGLLTEPARIARFLTMCDLLALPSRTDCFPSVQIEAMLCGTPPVTSDIPGAREAVRVTGMGRIVPPGDPARLAEGIVAVLRDRERHLRPREAVRAIFDLERSLDGYEELFDELVRTGSCTPDGPRASVPVRRWREPASWGSLRADDHARLDALLRNEADMAYRRRARILLDYLELADGETVLDGGCGMGFYLLAMGRLRRLRLVGLDGDLERARWARRERVPAALLCGDLARLPFPDATFDKILLSEVLEHVPDDRSALTELHRVLRPGGLLAISVPHMNYPFWCDPLHRTWTALGGEPIRRGPIAGMWSNHVRLYWPDDLLGRLEGAGFRVETAEETTHYGFPLSHFLVYGLGKPLVEHGLLPARLRRSADRLHGEENPGSVVNPINLGRALFRAVDRLNDRPAVARRASFVNVLAKARKPVR